MVAVVACCCCCEDVRLCSSARNWPKAANEAAVADAGQSWDVNGLIENVFLHLALAPAVVAWLPVSWHY